MYYNLNSSSTDYFLTRHTPNLNMLLNAHKIKQISNHTQHGAAATSAHTHTLELLVLRSAARYAVYPIPHGSNAIVNSSVQEVTLSSLNLKYNAFEFCCKDWVI